MGLIGLIKDINRMFPKPPILSETDKRENDTTIVKKYAQGNAFLQMGEYKTKEDIKKQIAETAQYNFMPKE